MASTATVPEHCIHIDHETFQELKAYLLAHTEQVVEKQRKHDDPPTSALAEALPALSPLGPLSGEPDAQMDTQDSHAQHNEPSFKMRLPWSHTEDLTILALVHTIGASFDLIAATLPGAERTAEAV